MLYYIYNKYKYIYIEIFGFAERTVGTTETYTHGESGAARSLNHEATRFSGW